jgi:cytochrome c-type biogenesis protein CcmH
MSEPRRFARWLAAALLAACALGAGAKDATPLAEDPVLEARMTVIASELRCLVCQNQTIADSHADLAADLRQQVRELLKQGKSDDEIRRYMTDRYGDFVLYKPPLKPTTALLWIGPGLLLAAALAILFVVLRRRQRLAADAFEPDDPEEA